MIVRDAAATLRACLESVRGVVDEMVIADTGSADSTMDLAREYGARIIVIPWENDFAAARNRSLAEVRAEWVLVLDADEVLDPRASSIIPRLIDARDIAGYQVTIRNYVRRLDERIWDRPAKPNDSALPAAKTFPGYVEHENVRLFRRDPRIFFVGRVHESVGPRIEASGLRLGGASLLIHHFGLAEEPEARARKNRLYLELGKLKASEMPHNAQAHFELGLVELDNMGNVEKALACFRRACHINPRFGVGWFFAGIALMRLGKYQEALKSLEQAEKSGKATADTAEISGDAHYNLGKFDEAIRSYQNALRLSPESVTIESKLGLAEVRVGLVDEGLRRIRRTTEQRPALAEVHDRLILALAWLEKIPEAAQAAEAKLRMVEAATSGDFLRAATLWAKQGSWARAMAIVHVGLQVHRDDAALKRMLEGLAVGARSGTGAPPATLSNSPGTTSGH